MKVGLQIYQFNWPGTPENTGSRLAEIAATADRLCFSSLWVMDHFWQVGKGFGPPEDPMLEGYSTISYLAAVTKKLKLGLMVTGAPYRHPGVLVKTVTTIDVLSGGRAYLGIGTGWYQQEAAGLGVPFPKTRNELIGRFSETLRIAKHMWSGDTSPFIGRYYRLEHPLCNPLPLSKPHPPILIGAEGEHTMLRLIAKYGDACNFHIGGPLPEYSPTIREWYRDRVPRITRKLKKLGEFCEEVGRSPDEIEVTVLGTIKVAPEAMSVDEIVDLCRELSGLGVEHVIFNMPNVGEVKPVEVIGEEVIPQVADLDPSRW